MLTRKRFMKLLILLMALSLVIVACDRPLPSADDNETTQNDNGYPDADGETAVGGNTATDPEGSSEVEVPAEADGETLAEEAESEEPGEVEEPSEVEVPAEADGETISEEGEVSEVEVPAEATPGSPSETAEEGESTTEEGEGEEPSEVEVPAEADGEPSTTEEGEAETSETEETAEEGETSTEEGEEPSEVEVPAEATEDPELISEVPATHTVAAGENLYRIGLQYGISWVAIAQENGITNPDRIFEGQVLDLPGGSGEEGAGGQPEPMPTPEGINYVVKPGDTLFKIAQQYNISWVEIAEANGIVNPNEIYAGEMIKIPVDAPMPPATVHHVVQPGETLFRISLQYGLPWLAIAHANDIAPPYHIYAGQTLIIPGGQP